MWRDQLAREVGPARAGACRRSARPSSRSRAAAAAMTSARSKRGRKIMRAPASSAPLVATNRPWVWKIGRACSSTSSAVKPPGLAQGQRVGGEIAVAQHGALGTAGGARGVEDGREVVRAARLVRDPPLLRPRTSARPGPLAPLAQRLDPSGADLGGERGSSAPRPRVGRRPASARRRPGSSRTSPAV